MNQKTILFFGVVGAGKGTQVELLQEYFKNNNEPSIYLYPGNEFRVLSNSGSYTSQRISDILSQGKLVPDFFTNALVVKMMQEKFTGREHVIFDGYPRSVNQAEAMCHNVAFFNLPQPMVILINISDDEAVKRLSMRGRSDDTPEGIKKRIDVYKEQVLPALDYLKENLQTPVYEINGEQSVKDVFADIMSVLDKA
ncbi:MAG: nucleoside monophosphate kinase [Candidatus Pacebacteria bacterium]|nr:nucleoside monophosphate kinase [Candidatus Paceibacterota bacterium]